MKKTKTGSAIQLVEAYRDSENRPRQHIILSIGNANLPKELWPRVADEIENKLKGIQTFFKPEKEVEEWTNKILRELQRKQVFTPIIDSNKKIITVNIDKISHDTSTELGPELVALKAWRSLEMDKILANLGFNRKQIKILAISIMNRLLDPCSENSLSTWLNTVSFSELFQNHFRDIPKDRFYRLADKLHKHKDSIEKALKQHEKQIFNFSEMIILYDVTNTYFEGKCLRNPKAKRGNSKEKRKDAPLLAVGLVLNSEGFPIRHEVFSGNRHDSTTLISMVERLNNSEETTIKPIIVLDGGMVSEDNLKELIKRGLDYIVVGKRPTRIAYEKEFQQLPFSLVVNREGKPPVKIAIKDEDKERIVLCSSESRAEKEKAIISKAEERFLNDIKKLQLRLEKGLLKNRELINRSLGRLLERHSRVTRYYKTTIETNGLQCKRIEEKFESALRISGNYYLRCSRKDLDEQTIWKLYMTLTRVEAGFRVLKSDLGLRPIYHQKEDRCDSHIFITVIAYHLLQWIEHTLRSKGECRSWSSIKRLLQTHAYTTIVCHSEDGEIIRIRSPGVPDPEQQYIYSLLSIDFNNLPRCKITSSN